MSNMKKWGVAFAALAIASAASAASYRYFSLRFERQPAVAMQPVSAQAVRTAGPRVAPVSGAQLFTNMETFNQGNGGVNTPAAAKAGSKDSRGTYIVIFREDALASYKGGAASQYKLGAGGRQRIDVRSSESMKYVGYLQGKQLQMEQQMSGMIQRPLQVRRRMQHAVNGIVADLSAAEAARVSKMANVRLVEEYREYKQDTDVGPTLIGAPSAWAGTVGQPSGASAVQGEGIIAGLIDSGINFGSPSFAGTDPVDGYVHVNPMGAGVYLGTCGPGGDDEGRCNSKLIGGYDFVCGAPANLCGETDVLEEPGFGDTNGHGSHTASTTAGNRRNVVYDGASLRISGVAPRANIIAYDTCYTDAVTGQGLCPNVSTLAAINQAVADGVDVINYSIGGGSQPWSEATSLAFLNAVDAGIYVAASAGNSGPGPNTLGHLEPWVGSTAAAQHGRGGFGTLMQVTGPAPVPAALQPVVMNNGTGGVSLTATIPGSTPLIVSPGIDTTSDGCAAFTAGAFTGGIAVIRRGSCSFSSKANNATDAGAIAVVITNNTTGGIIPSVPGTTVPVFGITQADGNALRDFYLANPTAAAQIAFPAVGLPNVADALGSFSSRGPAGNFDLVKPDITAPGVNILAAVSGTTITGSEDAIDLYSGTSMASPHHAGAAALIHQARPGWTMPEVKSALMMTATTQVYTEDLVTLANPFARGSGRIRIDRAIKAGLVLNETTANFEAADPANGGNPASLNVASLAKGSCYPTCTFTRTFRNPGTSGGLWRISITGVTGTANPALVWILPGATRSIDFTVDATNLPANGSFNFGEVLMELRQSGGVVDEVSSLRLPIAVAVAPPVVSVPPSVNATVNQGSNGSTSFNIGNTGGSNLNYTVTTTGNGTATVASALRGAVNSGFRNTIYTDASGSNLAQFAADDFDLGQSTQITSLSSEGFVVSGALLTAAAVDLTWSIYPDAAGLPAGDPQSAPGAAVWTYTAAPTAAGVSTDGGTIGLNLAAAGQNVVLPAGKYWLVVNTRGIFSNRWAQFASVDGNGTFAAITIDAGGTGAWALSNSFSGLSMTIKGSVPCGAPWFGAVTPASGSLVPTGVQSTSLELNSSSLAPATYGAIICVASNDPVTPVASVPVTLTVSPAPPKRVAGQPASQQARHRPMRIRSNRL